MSYPEVKLSLFPPYAITKKNWKIEHYKDILLSMNDNLIGFRTEKSCFILLSNTITFFTLALDTFVLLKFIGIKLESDFFPSFELCLGYVFVFACVF